MVISGLILLAVAFIIYNILNSLAYQYHSDDSALDEISRRELFIQNLSAYAILFGMVLFMYWFAVSSDDVLLALWFNMVDVFHSFFIRVHTR